MHWEGDPGQLDVFKGRKLSMLSYSHTRPLPLCGIGSAELRSVRNTMSQHGNQPEARQNRQGVKTTEGTKAIAQRRLLHRPVAVERYDVSHILGLFTVLHTFESSELCFG